MEYFRRFFNFWFPNAMWIVWIVIAGMGIYFFQTLIHEGMHNLTTIAASDGKSPKFAPFPHLYDPDPKKTGDEYFLNGVNLGAAGAPTNEPVRQIPDCNGVKKPKAPLKGFIGMPQVIDLIIITALFFLFFFAPVTNPIIRFPFFMWYLAAVVDFIYNTGGVAFGGCNEGNDWSKVFLEGYMGQGGLIGLTWVLWIVFILSNFLWVYYGKWGKERVEGSAFPQSDKFGDCKKFKDFSKFWEFRWLALTFGVLSYICVIWATFWIFSGGDPRVRTDSAEFLAFYILHILWGFGCFILFALSFMLKKKT